MKTPRYKVVLTGCTALEVVAAYFRDAGCEVPPADEPVEFSRPDFIYDVTSHNDVLAEEVPGFFDEKMAKLSGCPYSIDGIKAIIEEFFWYAEAARTSSSVKKVLAVDADNTLWRGIVSEDGRDALSPYSEFQLALKKLRSDGVILVALSKNDFSSPFIPVGMPLQDEDFSLMKINWAPKSGNLLEAVKALSLSADSVVFVDDNSFERAQMSQHLPEVAIVPFNGFPVDSARHERQLARRIREYFFSAGAITYEDKIRAADYQRRGMIGIGEGMSREEFLKSLCLWVKPKMADEVDLDRLCQMAGKTNQFNATTIRRSRDDFARMLKDEKLKVYTFRAGDKFGEQGLVCYVVVDLCNCRITDFVMSCRAMGRSLEYFAYSFVSNDLGYRPKIDFSETPKNRPFSEFLKELSDNAHGVDFSGYYICQK